MAFGTSAQLWHQLVGVGIAHGDDKFVGIVWIGDDLLGHHTGASGDGDMVKSCGWIMSVSR